MTDDPTQDPDVRRFLREMDLELFDEVEQPGEPFTIDVMARMLARWRAFLDERGIAPEAQRVLYDTAVEGIFLSRRWTPAECREMKDKFSAALGVDVRLPA